jgi:[ribosomal protein S18]-alanine N-acetyltransferase
MTFRFTPMSQADAEAIARWHYPEPFSFYDWAADPNDLAELLDRRRVATATSQSTTRTRV